MTERLNRRKIISGVVLSDKMDKTRVVQVSWTSKHEKYHKSIRRNVKYKAHDEKNESRAGDLVSIMETRPLSRDKRWMIREIIKKNTESQ